MRLLVSLGLCLVAAALAAWWLFVAEDVAVVAPASESTAETRGVASEPVSVDAVAEPTPLQREVVSEPVATGEAPAQTPAAGLQGLIEDPRGQPVAGARVRCGEGSEVESDADGRFALAAPSEGQELHARKQGWIQVGWAQAALNAEGRWKPVRLLLAPTATLSVEVQDSSGQPVRGAKVSASLAAAEPHGSAPGNLPFGSTVYTESTSTDADGLAHFTAIAAEQRLRIDLHGVPEQTSGGAMSFEGVDGSGTRLLAAHEAQRPLVLAPGETRTLLVRAAASLRIQGRVLASSGAPSAGAIVTLRELDVKAERWPGLRLNASTDEQGAFVLESLLMTRPGRLMVAASSSGGAGGWLASCEDPQECATVELAPAPEGPIEAELVLKLVLAPSIAGRVIDGTGAPVGKARVALHPLEGALLAGHLSTNRVRSTSTAESNGAFHLPVVPEGTYDIEVNARTTTWVRGVRAGASDLLIEVPGGKPARVTIEVTSEQPLGETILLLSRFHPWQPPIEAPALPERALYSEPRGWPAPALALWYGAQGHVDHLGEVLFSSWPMRARTYEAELDEGYYWIGAKARGKGYSTYPIGTGLVHVGAGEHHLTFQLEPAGRVRGRLIASGALDPALCIALTTASGQAVPLDVRTGRLESFAAPGAVGSFDLYPVPARALELRVGSRAELEAGTCRLRQAVQVAPGATV